MREILRFLSVPWAIDPAWSPRIDLRVGARQGQSRKPLFNSNRGSYAIAERSTLKKMDGKAKAFGLMNLSPEQIVSYLPAEDEQEYVEDLVNKSTEGTLTGMERAELDYFVQMEHLLQMVRSRAAKILATRHAA